MQIIKSVMKIKLLLLLLLFTHSFSQEKITLQLKWLHQFQFAGYYAAKEKGFYDDVGLDVEIKERKRKKREIRYLLFCIFTPMHCVGHYI